METNQIKPGDLVRLKIGGINMVAGEYPGLSCTETIICYYEHEGMVIRVEVSLKALKKV